MEKRTLKRTSWIFAVAFVLLISMVILTPISSQAADKYWIGDPAGGNWNFVFNWSPVGGEYEVPVDGDNAFIINAGPVILNMANPSYPVPINGSLQSLLLDNGILTHGENYTLNIVAPPDPIEPWINWNPPAIGFGVNGTYSLTDNGTLNSARTVVGVGGLFGSSPDFIPTNNPPLSGGGGLGIFDQSGTTTANHGQLWVGFNTYGEYNLSSGTVNIGGYEWGTLVIGGKDWYGKTYVGTGVFNQTGGDMHVNGLGLFMADGPGTTGTYNLGDGTLTVGGYYVIGGYGGTATFNQTGGTNTANGMLEVGGAGTGTYNLSAGNLNTDTTIVGAWGTGTFNQGLTGDGGTHTVIGTLEVGSHGSGTYNLIAGNLNTGSTIVGNFGTGTFNQVGGTHEVTGDLILAANPGTTGTYNLSGDPATSILTVGGSTIVGNEGYGTFTQNGGTHSIIGQLAVAFWGGGGTFNLNGGTLNAGFTQVGITGDSDHPGVFNQTGGDFITNGLWMANGCGGNDITGWCTPGSYAYYNLSDGGLTVNGEARIGLGGYAEFNQTGGSATFDYLIVGGGASLPGVTPATQGIVNLTDGKLHVTGDAIVGAGDPSYWELNKDNGLPLYGGMGTVNQTGGKISVGGNLILGHAGSNVSGTGSYNLSGTGNLQVTGSTIVGQGGIGTFNQSGGIHTTDGVVLGQWLGSSGTYDLSGTGKLSMVKDMYIGVEGAGSFIQNGSSTVEARNIFLGTSGGSGSYELKGGSLSVTGVEVIGYNAIGTFTQSGGTNTVSGDLVLGNDTTGDGKYNLSGGSLTVNGGMAVGLNGTGTFKLSNTGSLDVKGNEVKFGVSATGQGFFEQSGNSNFQFTGALYLGDYGYGKYTMTGGTLSGDGIALGEWGGKGEFYQSGGKVTVDNLQLARQNDPKLSSGYYELSGNDSKLTVNENLNVGVKGIGTFKQTGGTNSVGQNLNIAIDTGSTGEYNMTGGTLNVSGNINNKGTFNFTGGDVFANLK